MSILPETARGISGGVRGTTGSSTPEESQLHSIALVAMRIPQTLRRRFDAMIPPPQGKVPHLPSDDPHLRSRWNHRSGLPPTSHVSRVQPPPQLLQRVARVVAPPRGPMPR